MSAFVDVPDVLYYYTDAAGLQGILNPGSWPLRTEPPEDERFRYVNPDDYVFGRAAYLMASDVRYMNDSLELKYGASYVRSRFEAARDDAMLEPELREAFGRSAVTFTDEALYRWPYRCFAACFCREGDLLSQWRGYAGGTGGFAIGFSGPALAEYSCAIAQADHGTAKDIAAPAYLMSVAYGPADAAARVDPLVENLGQAWRDGSALTDPDGRPSSFVGLNAFMAMASIKHEAFEAEQEWRLLTVNESKYKVRTRARGGGLVPYVDFIVNSRLNVGDPPPRAEVTVHEIVVGPSPDQEGQVDAVRQLLRQRQPWWEHETTVRASAVPFRG